MNAGKWLWGRVVVVLTAFAMAGPTGLIAADFQADLDALYYNDAAGRTLNWDLSTGTVDAHGVVTIPTNVYTVPPAETGVVLTWEPDGGLTTKSFSDGVYHMAVAAPTPGVPTIPTASITVDGVVTDWAGVDPYIQDPTGDVWWTGVPSGADVEYVKLAYSADSSKLYILYKLTESANTNVWYRFFVNKNIKDDEGGLGVFQIDLQYYLGQWHVVSQGYLTDNDDSWYILTNDHGVVAVSGQYLEASVDTAAFGLPAKVLIFGRTMQSTSPYTDFDRFAPNFKETQAGAYLMGDDHITVAAPTTWKAAARFRGFANEAFGSTCPYIRFAGVRLSGGSQDSSAVQPTAQAFWVTGDFDGTELDNALVIMAMIEKSSESGDYFWGWDPPSGGGVALTGLDPSTTVVDLKLEVTNNGQTVTFYYRTNSSSGLDAGTWLTAVTKTLPAGTGTMYGAPTTSPHAGLDAGFNRTAPVYRLYNKLNGKHFFTIDRAEKNHALATWPWVFTDEGIKFYTHAEDSHPGAVPVYRFWSESLGTHFYTISESEKNHLVNDTPAKFFWVLEGPAFYAWPEGSQPTGATPVYRFWSSSIGSHVYTTSTAERDKLLATPASWFWTYEGVAFYTKPVLFDN